MDSEVLITLKNLYCPKGASVKLGFVYFSILFFKYQWNTKHIRNTYRGRCKNWIRPDWDSTSRHLKAENLPNFRDHRISVSLYAASIARQTKTEQPRHGHGHLPFLNEEGDGVSLSLFASLASSLHWLWPLWRIWCGRGCFCSIFHDMTL